MQLPLITTNGETIGIIFGIGSLIVIIVLPSLFIYFLSRDKKLFLDKDHQITWGRLYRDLHFKSKWQTARWFIFVMRRLVMATICFVLPFGCIQLVIMLLMNILVAGYLLHHKPMASKFKNRIELLNEMFITVATYHMIFFTDWIPDHIL